MGIAPRVLIKLINCLGKLARQEAGLPSAILTAFLVHLKASEISCFYIDFPRNQRKKTRDERSRGGVGSHLVKTWALPPN